MYGTECGCVGDGVFSKGYVPRSPATSASGEPGLLPGRSGSLLLRWCGCFPSGRDTGRPRVANPLQLCDGATSKTLWLNTLRIL